MQEVVEAVRVEHPHQQVAQVAQEVVEQRVLHGMMEALQAL
jgi:hypothetical protein